MNTEHTNKQLKLCYDTNPDILEIGIDEAGRGPLFGRVYASAVILPKNGSFDIKDIKDSKKFHSKKKMIHVANYIKENATAWAVEYVDENVIDEINILQATQLAMHNAIKKVISNNIHNNKYLLLIDGNYFQPFIYNQQIIPAYTIEQGDNYYASIAAASILAKVERDQYIYDMCNNYPELQEKYGLLSNKGYGTKQHIAGINKYGTTIWHRKTFGICKK